MSVLGEYQPTTLLTQTDGQHYNHLHRLADSTKTTIRFESWRIMELSCITARYPHNVVSEWPVLNNKTEMLMYKGNIDCRRPGRPQNGEHGRFDEFFDDHKTTSWHTLAVSIDTAYVKVSNMQAVYNRQKKTQTKVMKEKQKNKRNIGRQTEKNMCCFI